MSKSDDGSSNQARLVTGGLLPPVLDVGLIQSIFHTSPDFLLRLDSNGLLTYINQVFVEHGEPQNILGIHVSEFLMESSKPLLEEAMDKGRAEGEIGQIEVQMQLGVWLQVRVFPIWQGEEFDGFVLISSDVTRLKGDQEKLEEENRVLQNEISMKSADLAQEAERRERLEKQLVDFQRLESLGALASGVAHEYNNLLTVIMGNAGLAQMLLPEDSPAREAIKHLETATLHATELTNQLRTYSGHARVKTERLDLSQCVKELTALIAVGIKGEKQLLLDCQTDLPIILGDLGQIQQVLMHLIGQSLKNLGNEPGAIHIRTYSENLDENGLNDCAFRAGLEPGLFTVLETQDDGHRLSSEAVSHFFEPFSPHRPANHGLGMAAVLGIVRSYGGTLKVRSDDSGNVVSLFFPPFLGATDSKVLPESPILLVDDEEAVRGTVGSLLNQLGFAVVAVPGGEGALEYLQKDSNQVTLAILDAHLEGMSGVEAFDGIRKKCPDIPIVVMSGYSQEHTMSLFEGRGVSGFLKKPFRFSELENAVQKAIVIR